MNLKERKLHLEMLLHQKISSVEPKARGMCNLRTKTSLHTEHAQEVLEDFKQFMK